ncbi:protein of unknown function [Sphingomonas sp. NFR04]|uniref:DUF1521 domain-containing protein n=1 Tax=Sphingomonas sp. NFR04 TaxID=1566283 RepID=UPI0008E5CDA8|nr:DUF1521 domain-containing protein [Sphingomonas sp. NFR04]SFJ64388.1 protein of unknown function [Sphingomonas sp. NFR04]
MTTISTAAATPFAAAQLALAGGVLAQQFNPLGASAYASAMLPSLLSIQLGTTAGTGQLQPQAGLTAQTTGQNTARVDLGDGYHLAIDERNSEMTIVNDATGQSTRVWGDPHVDVNGKHQFDFYGTTTFELANGTKITVNTEQAKSNPNVYFASQVVVTRGANAVVIDGISQQQQGDLAVSVSTDGYALDAANRDGFTVQEAAGGWQTELGATVTQADADLTKLGQIYGPDSAMPSLSELGSAIGGFLLFGSLLGAAFDMSASFRSTSAHNDRAPLPGPFRPYA